MDKATQKRLKVAGWTVGTVDEFLNLTPAESLYIDLKLRLSDAVRERRQARKLSQAKLAELIGSSQSRVAKMEAHDPAVSIDLLITSLFALGVKRDGLARIIR